MAGKLDQLVPWRLSSPNGKIKANVIVTGTTGSGKSALVNALFGKQVSEETDHQRKRSEKHTLTFKGSSIAIWDTCGFAEPDSETTKTAFDTLKSISCITKSFTLLYTIGISKTRFEANSNDVEGMKKLSEKFGNKIWNNTLVVFTFANEHYDLVTRGIEDEEEKKIAYLEKLALWKSKVQEHLTDEIVPGSIAKKIPFAAAGYLNSETDPEVLDFDSKGKSWILDVWQKIAQASPLNDKPLLLDICINKFYSANFLYCDSYLSLVKLYSAAYKEIANSEVGSAYAFLHLLLFRLDNTETATPKRLIPSETRQCDIKYWTSLSTSIQVTVTGTLSSGKTSLINAMAHGNHKENVSGEEHREDIKLRSTKCTLIELLIPDLSSKIEDSSLTILCIRFNDTKTNMTATLRSFSQKVQDNFLIVLTFSNVNVSHEEFSKVVENQTSTIKDILAELKMSQDVVDKLKVVPAGYHTETIIAEDPSNSHWIINLWFAAISQAKPNSQPAMIVLLNYLLHKKFFPKKMALCKPAYKKSIIDMLLEIIKVQELQIEE